MSLLNSWHNRFRWVDPLIGLALSAGFAWWVYGGGGLEVVRDVLDGNRAAVYGTLASIFGSLLGFVIAAIAIVLGYADSGRLTFLRDSKTIGQLWRVFSSNIWWLAGATLTSFLALIFDRERSPAEGSFIVIGFFVLLMATGTVARSVWTLELLIRAVMSIKGAADDAPAIPGAGPSRLPPNS